jgi:phosphomannomutase
MNLTEYAVHDATGLAHLVARKEVTPRELAQLALKAIEAVNPQVNAVVETYPDRIEALDEATLGSGGRVLVRYSGTELKARVMIEGDDAGTIRAMAERIADALHRALA